MFLYADEFQTYGTSMFASMLSEMRKFHLKMVLAHQFINQVADRTLQKSILANVSRRVLFNMDYEDATILAEPYNDIMRDFARDLGNLPNYTAYDDGRRITTDPFDAPRGKLPDVIERSRRRFGRKILASAPRPTRHASL